MPTAGKTSRIRSKYRQLPKWAKGILIALLIFFILMIVTWLIMAWYINNHKKELLAKITAQVSENINGNFHIDDMEPALLNGFPNIAIRLKGVTLSDSLYKVHKKNLVDLQSVYVKFNVLSLLTKNPKIAKVTIADGSIYLFTSKSGYSNVYLFKKKDQAKKKGTGKEMNIDRFGIEDVQFTFDNFQKNKQFKIDLNAINGTIKTEGDIWNIDADSKVHFHQLGFNIARGGFVKNKDLRADLQIVFNKKTKQVKLPKQQIKVDGTAIFIGCTFNFGNTPPNYTINIDAPSIGLKEGASYLSRHIASKLDSFDLENNLSVQVLVNGSFQYPDTPLVHARWQTKDNVLISSFGKMEQTSLKGEFFNNIVPEKGRGDANSAITITNLSASYAEIPIRADSIMLYGLINPLMKLKLVSKFPVEKLDAIVGNTFDFKGGEADVQLNYTGPLLAKDTFRHSMYGYIRIRDAALTYLPRSLSFSKCNVNLDFLGNDLALTNTTLASPRSNIRIDGIARNFMNVYFLDPGKVDFNWNINSSQVDLVEYKSFIAPRRKGKRTSQTNQNHKIARIANRLEQLLEKSDMHLHVNVNKLLYSHFQAQKINADIDLTSNAISMRNIKLLHAGGSVAAEADINTAGTNTPFNIRGKINNVKVDQLLYAFDNFGQNTLRSENIKGSFTADVNIRGIMRETGAVITPSLNGKLSFVLNNGELNHFPPFETIKKFLFKKRNLDHITFSTLKNDFDISNGKITINPMSIESSALIIGVSGVYAFDKGTDLSIAIPLRHPDKNKELIAQGKKPRKGIVIYLRAQDGDDGKVEIKWDPLKKGVKDDSEEPDVDAQE